MTPIKHPACNTVLARPPGTTEKECGDLPVLRHYVELMPVVTSFWLPDAAEAENLRQGGAIALSVWGATHPPLGLAVLPPETPATPSGPDSPPETPPETPGTAPERHSTATQPTFWGRIRKIASAPWKRAGTRSMDFREVREVIAPVLDWYQSDEHPPRPLICILRDIVQDLQDDRAEALQLRPTQLERQKLREELVEVRRELQQREAEILTLANGDRLLPDASNNAFIVADRLGKLKALRRENAELRDKLNMP